MITTPLIFAIAFSLIFLMLLLTLIIVYFNEKPYFQGLVLLLYSAMLCSIMISAALFAEHFKQINNQQQQQQELLQNDNSK